MNPLMVGGAALGTAAVARWLRGILRRRMVLKQLYAATFREVARGDRPPLRFQPRLRNATWDGRRVTVDDGWIARLVETYGGGAAIPVFLFGHELWHAIEGNPPHEIPHWNQREELHADRFGLRAVQALGLDPEPVLNMMRELGGCVCCAHPPAEERVYALVYQLRWGW